jgi:hypothetical protein
MTKNQLLNRLATISILLSIAGCDDKFLHQKAATQFDIKSVGNRIFLVEQTSGQLFEMSGGRLIEVKRIDDAHASALVDSRFLRSSGVKSLEFAVQTKLRRDSVQYKIEISPEMVAMGGASKTFQPKDSDWAKYWSVDGNFLNINFIDSDGFNVASEHITLAGIGKTGGTTIVDENDATSEYEYNGSLPLDVSSYEAIKGVNVTYRLEKPKK